MHNKLTDIITKRQLGINAGVPSFCCANKLVIEAILEHAYANSDTVLIEATSNQVNQENGYMDMKPADFTTYVYHIADKLGVPREQIILGGDHMGPLPWCNEPAAVAMEKAKELVQLCVKAGYKKIHLDTSMRLGDDDPMAPLADETIAERGVMLYQACQEAYEEMKKENPAEIQPVYVVGSEVPIPGGAQDEEGLVITSGAAFEKSLLTYRKVFKEHGIPKDWENVIAFVVQPGVEFTNNGITRYDRHAARELCNTLRTYPDVVFEGHSTDYQPPQVLREMVEDGIAIIKVGPALTFAYREAIFALAMMEKELIDEAHQSHFKEILEEQMLANDKYWKAYYFGSDREKFIQREYGYSDRSRYYMSLPVVEDARRKLFANLDECNISLSMLHQYLPVQSDRVKEGRLKLTSRDLVKNHINEIVDNYYYAVKQNYIVSGILG